MSAPLLSIVIIGRNEGTRLERCLQSVFRIDDVGGPVEVLYVDSNSTDGSPDRARAMGVGVFEVKPTHPTAAFGRNAGWRGATGMFVLFLDGDTILEADFPRKALRAIQTDSKIAVVFGTRREMNPNDTVYNRILDLDWISRPGLADYCGGDALMRRSVLEAVNGYDEGLIAGEEPEMCRRMREVGWKILHIDALMTLHDLAMTGWSQYWRRATRTGYAYAQVSARFRNTNDPFWEHERKHNRQRGAFWCLMPPAAVALSVILWSVWPAIAALGLLVLLSLRSAWNFRWKSNDWLTLILYGFHSHIQHIPILIGQRQYDRDVRNGVRRGLIEYKEAAR
ncbi:MAG: glycosyltransferase [Bryobacteraceae bacterium]|nr:glycosyltransferase [Bryobacteraceae bacterium]